MSITNGGDWEATLDLDDIFTIQIQDNEKKDILLNGNGIENATLNTDLEYLIEYRNEVFNLIGINERGVISLDNTLKDLEGTDLFPATLGTYGTISLPNGWITKTGESNFPLITIGGVNNKTVVGDTIYTITFPLEFPNSCDNIVITLLDKWETASRGENTFHITEVSKSQFKVIFQSPDSRGFRQQLSYIAIGS